MGGHTIGGRRMGTVAGAGLLERRRMSVSAAKVRGLFVSPVFVLLGSEVIAKGVMFLSSIPIARLYDPEAMGVFGVYNSIVTIVSVPAALSLARAVPLPRSEAKAFVLLSVGMGLIVGVSLLTFAFFAWAPATLLARLGADDLRPLAWVLPFAVLGWAGLPLMQMWLSRMERFFALAATKLAQVFLLAGGQITLGLPNMGATGLTSADALSRAIVMTPFLLWMAKPLGRWAHRPARFLEMSRQVFTEYRRFPLIVTPTLLLHSIPAALMPIMISSNLGVKAAGYWALSAYVTSAVFGISVSFTPYLYGLWSKAFNSREGLQPSLVIRSSVPLIAIAAGVGVALGTLGPTLFSLVFGLEWARAGELAQILAISLAVQIIAGPMLLILNVVNRESWNISLAILWCILSAIAFYAAGALDLGLGRITWLYVGITCVIYVAYAAAALLAVHRSRPLAPGGAN